MVGILGLIVAIVCVIALIWKNWHMAIVSLAGALIVIAFNAMDPVTTLSEKFMTGMSGFAGTGSCCLCWVLFSVRSWVTAERLLALPTRC